MVHVFIELSLVVLLSCKVSMFWHAVLQQCSGSQVKFEPEVHHALSFTTSSPGNPACQLHAVQQPTGLAYVSYDMLVNLIPKQEIDCRR